MLKNKQHDGNSMDRVIIINEPDPYVLLKHLKEPVSRIIEGNTEDGEPVVFYDRKNNETFVFNYLYVISDNDDTFGLKTLSMLIDPSSSLLFPDTRNLSILKLAITSKKLIDKRIGLRPLHIIDELSKEFADPMEVIFTISSPVYSVSRVWNLETAISSELLFEQILDFLKVIFTYYKKGLNKAIDTFNAFCMDILVHHKRIVPNIQNKIVIVSEDISNHLFVKGFDLIVPGNESLYPIVIIRYLSSYHEAFIPITLDSKEEHPMPNLQISDMSIFLSRTFHNSIVHKVSSVILSALESIEKAKPLRTGITIIETTNVKKDLQNLLIEKYGIKKHS